ncbi:MAG TPA: L-lactate dehydrogenase [Gammaproteobacteria bacterium]|jgi:L-lactate dehydrogenase (cytochrome)|nr:L-lactate dehydrogenase [Gammaproteobacteria bacterium]
MKTITCIEDLRALHQRRVPRMFYDYAEAGSWTESTFRRNKEAFDEIKLRQRVAKDISTRSVAGTMLDEQQRLPMAIAPTGLTGMQYANGEILAAQAAEEFGVPFTLSTMSICSLEDVAAHTQKPFWFQLYVMKDREFIAALIERAKAAGCSALVLTLDLQIIGQRHKDLKNQMTAPPRLTLKNLINMASKPRWCAAMLATRRHSFGNIIGHAKGVENLTSLSEWSAQQLDPSLSWDDVAWVQEQWGGKLILKGIMDAEDAAIAAGMGVDAIIVSNHGGRQLDGAPASLDVLPQIVDVVNGACEVWLDGGIRSGQDVFKAKALGADATLIGKAFLNGLGARGKAGVTQCLEIIEKELDLTMAFCGKTDLREVDAEVIYTRP